MKGLVCGPPPLHGGGSALAWRGCPPRGRHLPSTPEAFRPRGLQLSSCLRVTPEATANLLDLGAGSSRPWARNTSPSGHSGQFSRQLQEEVRPVLVRISIFRPFGGEWLQFFPEAPPSVHRPFLKFAPETTKTGGFFQFDRTRLEGSMYSTRSTRREYGANRDP